jgi:GT2 family glycosyltransferase
MKISLIIINYNSSHHTLACIESVIEQTLFTNYEIIVVDNGSQISDFVKLNSLTAIPRLKLVRSNRNLGFSGGHLFGLKEVDPASSYYFFLNNDCLLLDDLCSRLVSYMQENSRVGICTGQMVRPSGEFDPSFTYFPTVGSKLLGHAVVRWLNPSDYPKRQQTYHTPIQVPVVMGSALFVRATAFWEVGGFDPSYFLYCEEEDLCRNMRQRNWTAALVPDVQFLHIGGGSTESNPVAEKEYYISLFHYFRKHTIKPVQMTMRLFYFLKIGRRCTRDSRYARLAWFILRGASNSESLRHRFVG